ncbi:MAG: flagellar type III secretion system pore protein FliP [Halioglobus sp.]|nr:flagellar type III secretion system pore protein FliP [Halioglobus sp.]MCB1710757.1 flagellar type III secretion system pore protein FliP [Halioglobus sp.]MCP5120958.1 flagellar type III secretion system pore protein FliP [Pseudomonadales bacterium]MCP5194400.1 flagellar type III secretion system pore protein FliP [Pseudomonadales bacterium]
MRYARALLLLVLGLSPALAAAQATIPLLTVEPLADGGSNYSVSVQLLMLMTLLSLLPAILLAMTSFTRVVVVLAILRQALGTAQTPSNQIIIGLALFLSLFIMAPVLERAYEDGLRPYLDEKIEFDAALLKVEAPFREFMLNQVREADLTMFAELGGYDGFQDEEDIPLKVLLPSFLTSELKTAFQIGFLIFIPFLVIDLVVASVLMSMGMMMLSPMLISLPFKLMLFVLIDGWSLIAGTLAATFVT